MTDDVTIPAAEAKHIADVTDARAWLSDFEHTTLEADRMRDALVAVLDLHKQIHQQQPWCDQDGFAWPCVTIRVINKALGVGDE